MAQPRQFADHDPVLAVGRSPLYEIAIEIPGLLEAGGEPADLADGHPVIEFGALRDVTDAFAQQGGVLPGVVAEDARDAAIGRRESVEDADGRGLAGAVVAKQGKDGPGRHAEAKVVQRLCAGIDLGYLVKLDGCVHAAVS